MPIGKGMMGGPRGTYGKYNIGVNANLSTQFQNADNVEEQQRRRFSRKRESGFVGNGYWFANYPYMVGAMMAGTDQRLVDTDNRHETSETSNDQMAAPSAAMGSAGTASYMGGM